MANLFAMQHHARGIDHTNVHGYTRAHAFGHDAELFELSKNAIQLGIAARHFGQLNVRINALDS